MAHNAHVHSPLTKQHMRLSLPKSHALNSIRDRTTSNQRRRTDTTIRKTAQSLASKHTQKECQRDLTIIQNTAAVSPGSRHPLFQATLLATQQDAWLTPETSTRQEQGCNTALHRSAILVSWFFRTLHGDSFVFPKDDTHCASTKVEPHSKPARLSWVPPWSTSRAAWEHHRCKPSYSPSLSTTSSVLLSPPWIISTSKTSTPVSDTGLSKRCSFYLPLSLPPHHATPAFSGRVHED